MRRGLLGAVTLAWAICGCGGGDDPAGAAGSGYPKDDLLRLNQLQAKGSHNSYHVASPTVTVDALKYTHAPLDVQLAEQGVRQFELDIRYDATAGEFEVYHIGLLDEGTTCRRFVDCLVTLENWSSDHPGHHVLFVQIEPKDPLPADPETYLQNLDAAILSAWPRERIVAPADVQGQAATLREAIVSVGWPTLGATRGKALFFLDESGAYRDAYTHGGQDLDGRVIFVDSEPGAPFEATYVLNNPVPDALAIADAVSQGFLVRTRADADNVEPFAGDTSTQTAAFASGAHMISTDYPAPVAGVDYVTQVPGGQPSRCNPVTAPPDCTATDIEDPARLE